jgi:hypothetical protein
MLLHTDHNGDLVLRSVFVKEEVKLQSTFESRIINIIFLHLRISENFAMPSYLEENVCVSKHAITVENDA